VAVAHFGLVGRGRFGLDLAGLDLVGRRRLDRGGRDGRLVDLGLLGVIVVVVVVVVVIVVRRGLALARTADALRAAALRGRGAPTARLVAPPALGELLGLVAREHDSDVRRALADPEVAAARASL